MNTLIELNDWKTGRFLKSVASIQIAVLVLTGLAALGLDIPVLREIIGCIYLTFVPGALVLRLLKLHQLGSTRTLLYMVALSLAFLMFTGFLINTIYPVIGISAPISLLPLVLTVSVLVLIMCALVYWRDKSYIHFSEEGENKIPLLPVLLLVLIPLLSLLGTRLVDVQRNNVILLVTLTLIMLVVALVILTRFIPRRIYPLAILMISIALLVHWASLSPNLWGSDILIEHQVYKMVELNKIWDPNLIAINTNSMLSVTILPAFYHHIAGVESLNIFKIIYPLIFSLVPLGIYEICRQQTNEKTALLATFFFMSFFTFFGTMLVLGKQQIGELLIVCIMLLLIDKKMVKIKRTVLLLIFSAALVVTHYALSIIYIGFLILSILVLYLVRRPKESRLTGAYVGLCIIMAYLWYTQITEANVLNAILSIGQYVYTNLAAIFDAMARQELLLQAIGFSSMGSFPREIARVVFWMVNLFIGLGIVELIIKRFKGTRFDPLYIVFALISIIGIFTVIVLPYFVAFLNIDRFYHIMLLFLSPFCILGGRAAFRWLGKLFNVSSQRIELYGNPLVLIVLLFFFFTQTGFFFEVVGDTSSSIPLGMKRIEQSDDIEERSRLYNVYIHRQTVLGVNWLSSNADNDEIIYTDYWRKDLVESYGAIPPGRVSFITDETEVGAGAYIYLGYANVAGGVVDIGESVFPFDINSYSNDVLDPLLQEGSLIYSNGGSKIYKFME